MNLPTTFDGSAERTFRFPIETAEALWLPSLEPRVRIVADGAVLRAEKDGDYLWNTPLLIRLPPATSQLEITIFGARATGGRLGPIWVGPFATLGRSHAARLLIQKTLPLVVFGLLVGAALILLAVWSKRREERMALWAAVAMSAWAVHSLNYVLSELPIGHHAWQVLAYAAFAWFAFACLRFSAVYCRLAWPRSDRLILLAVVVINLALLISETWFPPLSQACLLLALGIGTLACVRLIVHRRRVRSADPWPLIASGAAMLLVGIHGMLAQLGLAPAIQPYPVLLAAPLLALGLGVVGVSRFVRALEESEALAMAVQRRAAERERLLTDMHDGVGHQLTVALAASKLNTPKTEVEDAIRGALDEMRFLLEMPDTTHTDETVDLLDAIAGARDALERRLRAAGFVLEWAVEPGSTTRISARAVMQLFRILQEATTNAIKHSGGSRVRLSVRSAGDGTVISVADDGELSSAGTSGRGLTNMRSRAEAIGARLDFDSSEGFTVTLTLPDR